VARFGQADKLLRSLCSLASIILQAIAGRLAQLVRARASHARGQRFESSSAHHINNTNHLSRYSVKDPLPGIAVRGIRGAVARGRSGLLAFRPMPFPPTDETVKTWKGFEDRLAGLNPKELNPPYFLRSSFASPATSADIQKAPKLLGT
jgi:hypothetical protein